tara:strand:+ start:379 stop:1098 length:720 start_codon:yes stop_codon:yes gene_type:complete
MNQEITTSQDTKVEATEAQPEVSKNNPSQEEVSTPKTYTQEQVDAIAAQIRKKEEARVSRKFEGVDVEHYRELADKEEKSKIESQKRKGEFETILKEQQSKSAEKIQGLTNELTKIKVDGALLNAASTKKAINPEQVVRLVRDQIKMDESGQVEIIDPKSGQARYTDTGDAMTVDGLVSEFLKTNPHFVQAGLPGAGSSSNTKSAEISEVDINSLDLKNPEQKRLYAELRQKKYPNIGI